MHGTDSSDGLRAWVDIENPPQVQYLVPLVREFERRGAEVLVTARDYGMTFNLLRERGLDFTPVGRHFGARKRAKVVGTARRIHDLRALLRSSARPSLVLSASRSASLAARSLGIPFFRRVRLRVCQPLRVPPGGGICRASRRHLRGHVSRSRHLPRAAAPFRGIKEDITFADVDFDGVQAHVLPRGARPGTLNVLVRPPAEESHYHRDTSSALGRRTIELLAADETLTVIYSPRYEWQVAMLSAIEWRASLVVLHEAVPFASLLKAVDVVLSGGGTMVREAAYLGIPAISLFQGNVGEVDEHLERVGRLAIVRSASDLAALDLHRLQRRSPLAENPRAAEEVVDSVIRVAGAAYPRHEECDEATPALSALEVEEVDRKHSDGARAP